jgi:hypothetical protein
MHERDFTIWDAEEQVRLFVLRVSIPFPALAHYYVEILLGSQYNLLLELRVSS